MRIERKVTFLALSSAPFPREKNIFSFLCILIEIFYAMKVHMLLYNYIKYMPSLWGYI